MQARWRSERSRGFGRFAWNAGALAIGEAGHLRAGGTPGAWTVERILVVNPRLLPVDEPISGLALYVVDELLAALRTLARGPGDGARRAGAEKILPFADEAIGLDRAAVAYSAPSAVLTAERSALVQNLVASGRTA